MVMIRAIIRPEKVDETLKTLADAGYPAVTKRAYRSAPYSMMSFRRKC